MTPDRRIVPRVESVGALAVAWRPALAGLLMIAFAMVLATCEPGEDRTVKASARPVEQPQQPEPAPTAAQTITIGDIEPDEPTKKIKRFTPLADYLVANLSEFGVTQGDVALAQDIEDMGRMIREGIVDVYIDSAFPALATQKLSGSRTILRRWKSEDPEYWSTYVALRDSGIGSVEDMVGKLVAFEEPHSTSGFVLPAGTLAQRGFSLKEFGSLNAQVASDEIGYYFTGDEQNTFELIIQGTVGPVACPTSTTTSCLRS